MLKNLVSNLDSRNSSYVQQEAVKGILEISDKLSDKDIGDLLKIGDKFTWTNVIKILSLLKYPRIKNAMADLIILMQDLNWPGSLEAQELLKTIDFDFYKDEFVYAINKSIEENDFVWTDNLLLFVIEIGQCAALDRRLVRKAVDLVLDNNCRNATYLLKCFGVDSIK